MSRRVAVLLALLLLPAACASPTPGAAQGGGSSPTAAAPSPSLASPSPEPSPSPSPSDSPTPAPPPSPTPQRSSTPVKPPAGPISCNGSAGFDRTSAGGTGPGGSVLTTGSSAVALTFDDGPDPVHTPMMLDLLKQCGVKATFCLVGFRARDNPAVVRRIHAEGHTLCNHSWQHLFDLAKRDDAYIVNDLKATNRAILKAAPGAQIKYFRAPGGNFTSHLVDLARTELGMESIYWHVDPRDWDSHNYGTGDGMVKHIVKKVQADVRPGSIVLSHDNKKPDTITAYRTLLPWLKARTELIALPVDINPA